MRIIKQIIKKLLNIKYYKIGINSKIIYPNKIINPFKEADRIVIGNNTILKCEIQILGHGGKVKIGDYCFIGENSYIWSGNAIEIGNRVLIGHACNIFDNDIHLFDSKLRHLQFLDIISSGHPKKINLNDQRVIIEDDVWLGANVSVLKGVRIGKGAIIGANSLVTKDIEPFTVNAGNPTKILRRLDEVE